MRSGGESEEAGKPAHGAAICFAFATIAAALFMASQAGTQVKWIDNRAVFAQPGFWPVMAVGGMVIFGALHLTSLLFGRSGRSIQSAGPELLLWIRALEFAGWFLAYVLSVPVIGYLPATLVFTGLLAFRLGYRSQRQIVSALLTGAATVIVFKSLLAVKIPGGALYETLPPALRNFMILYL